MALITSDNHGIHNPKQEFANCQNVTTGQERVKKFGFSLPIEEGNKIWLKPINIKFSFYYLHFYTHPFFIHTLTQSEIQT